MVTAQYAIKNFTNEQIKNVMERVKNKSQSPDFANTFAST